MTNQQKFAKWRCEMEKIQENYNKVLATIEKGSCYKFSAGVMNFGAFLIPVDSNGKAMATPFLCSWSKLLKLAKLLKTKALNF